MSEFLSVEMAQVVMRNIIGNSTSTIIKWEAEIPNECGGIERMEYYGTRITPAEYIKATAALYRNNRYYFGYDIGDKDFQKEFLKLVKEKKFDTPMEEYFTFTIYPMT